ncbi:MAG: LysR family transcriptional regulator substrate-binding protein, partial [Oscillospiraceae bacterium]|nr:LysR family transcriptional regulator substrate-binding protein [Oscillospiraceae bacterium]
LKDENFVAYTIDSVPRYDLDELCRKKNFSPRIICESGSLYEQLEVVRRQNCVKVTSEETARNVNISGLRMIPISDEDTFIDLYMVYKKGNESRPHLAELRDFIAEYFRGIRAEAEE